MQKPFDFLVFIGRFQPFHRGHLAVIEAALQQAEQVVVVCGSAHQPRTNRNPWTWQEREQMLRATLPDTLQDRVLVAPLMDAPYNDDLWIRNVQATVNGLVAAGGRVSQRTPRTGWVGCVGEHSPRFLTWFPQWETVTADHCAGISATALRHGLFGVSAPVQGVEFLRGAAAQLPGPVSDWLCAFSQTPAFEALRDEQAFVAQYQAAWAVAPYEPNFVTVDALVVQSGHILLVERKRRPGMGLLALPGGFVDPHERIRDACLRELQEETGIPLPLPLLRDAIKRVEVFDDPCRSARGRTITHAFYIALEPASVLPEVEGGDDASTAQWVPLADLDPARMFEDHYFIIQAMLGL